jgi:hypothetical protein
MSKEAATKGPVINMNNTCKCCSGGPKQSVSGNRTWNWLCMYEMKNSRTSYIWHDKIWSMGTCNINSRPSCVGVYIWWEWMVLSSWKTSVCQKGTFLSALHCIYTLKKYLIKFHVYNTTVDAPIGTENEVYRVQQEVTKQQIQWTCVVNYLHFQCNTQLVECI